MSAYILQGRHDIGINTYICKCFVVIMISLVLGSYNVGAEEVKENYAVRKVRWGMTPEQVKKSEVWDFIRKQDKSEDNEMSLSYQGALLDRYCHLVYTFNSGRLISVTYFLMNPNGLDNLDRILPLYRDQLVAKYGEPVDKSELAKMETWVAHGGKTYVRLVTQLYITIFYQDKEYADSKSGYRIDTIAEKTQTENPF